VTNAAENRYGCTPKCRYSIPAHILRAFSEPLCTSGPTPHRAAAPADRFIMVRRSIFFSAALFLVPLYHCHCHCRCRCLYLLLLFQGGDPETGVAVAADLTAHGHGDIRMGLGLRSAAKKTWKRVRGGGGEADRRCVCVLRCLRVSYMCLGDTLVGQDRGGEGRGGRHLFLVWCCTEKRERRAERRAGLTQP